MKERRHPHEWSWWALAGYDHINQRFRCRPEAYGINDAPNADQSRARATELLKASPPPSPPWEGSPQTVNFCMFAELKV